MTCSVYYGAILLKNVLSLDRYLYYSYIFTFVFLVHEGKFDVFEAVEVVRGRDARDTWDAREWEKGLACKVVRCEDVMVHHRETDHGPFALTLVQSHGTEQVSRKLWVCKSSQHVMPHNIKLLTIQSIRRKADSTFSSGRWSPAPGSGQRLSEATARQLWMDHWNLEYLF